MKRFVLPIAATVLSFGLVGAFAAETMIISNTDMPKLTEWVKTPNKTSISAPSGFTLSVGAVLPDTVTMYEFPASVGIKDVTKYRYVLIDGKTVLVDPADRKVVQIIG